MLCRCIQNGMSGTDQIFQILRQGAEVFLNVAFIMVVTSLLVQGWTIKPAAHRLKLIVPSRMGPLERIELELPGNPKHELLIYRVLEESPLVIGGATLPRWARPSLVVRKGRSMQPEHAGQLQSGDLVYLFTPPEYTMLLDRLFSQIKGPDQNDKEYFGQFMVNIDAPLVDLISTYDLQPARDIAPDLTVGEFLMSELGAQPVVGDRVPLGKFDFVVRRVHQGKSITEVGLALTGEDRPSAFVRKARRPKVGLRTRFARMLGLED